MSFFTEDQINTLTSNNVRCDFLVKMEFKSETVYVWNGDYPLTVNGITYKPLHGIAQISGLGQNAGTDSAQISFSVTGIPDQAPDFLALTLAETPEANQQLVTVYMQFFDDEWQPVGNPLAIWWGYMQPPRISRDTQNGSDGQTQSITMTAENAFYNRSRPPRGRYTDRDQQQRYPGDTFFQFVPTLLNFSTTYPDY